ncbi:phosphoribosylformylglycinamidine cyclo-ligase [bacterium]|nr:phosphoribosylformylglycinamidine cyclo-ligase [bacterium]
MSEERKQSLYAAAGVDIDAASKAVGAFKSKVAETFTPGVLSQVGNFGGMFSLAGVEAAEPVLISSTDGVGTKLLVAQKAHRHDTVGECLVNHCVNDIMVQGARPLFFMDYISVGKLRPEHIASVMDGFIRGCKRNGVALLGGETAEMPDLYGPEDYDLAGFIVGVVDRSKLITGERVRAGHVLVGLSSNGLHTNGYSLARRIVFDLGGHAVNDPLPEGGGVNFGEALLAVHRSYKVQLEALYQRGLVDAAAHITGGGLTDNLPRVFPDSLDAEIKLGSWSVPRLFTYLQEAGRVELEEMLRVFNMGIGMVLLVDGARLEEALGVLKGLGEQAHVIGRMRPGSGTVRYV